MCQEPCAPIWPLKSNRGQIAGRCAACLFLQEISLKPHATPFVPLELRELFIPSAAAGSAVSSDFIGTSSGVLHQQARLDARHREQQLQASARAKGSFIAAPYSVNAGLFQGSADAYVLTSAVQREPKTAEERAHALEKRSKTQLAVYASLGSQAFEIPGTWRVAVQCSTAAAWAEQQGAGSHAIQHLTSLACFLTRLTGAGAQGAWHTPSAQGHLLSHVAHSHIHDQIIIGSGCPLVPGSSQSARVAGAKAAAAALAVSSQLQAQAHTLLRAGQLLQMEELTLERDVR